MRDRLLKVLSGVPKFPGEVAEAIRRNDPGMGMSWPTMAVLLAALYLFIGGLARRGLDRWGRSHFMYLFNPEPANRGEKISYLATRAIMQSLGLTVQLAIAGILLVAVQIGGEPMRVTGSLVIIWTGFAGLLFIIFQALFAPDAPSHRLVRLGDDAAIAEETGGMVEAERGDEGGAVGATRLATLLPIFRNFLLGVIVVIAGMVILSEMGIDIGPLFAGAGVIGLAIGFGAQSLIRDVFSGAFFLIDDAFRRGEYIDLGSVKGTVERISIRSMQLRHHLGPLHTIPFGEIQHLTNYSRDWVTMKLPLRVTYDTDVEKVRKLIKKLGQELQEHPELGDKFLEPLKSQGVFKMEDSAMIIRMKFMTKPGDQFMVRKLVYTRIRELFAENGIKFAHREVTVRVADDRPEPLDQEGRRALAGAVLPTLDAEAAPSSDAER